MTDIYACVIQQESGFTVPTKQWKVVWHRFRELPSCQDGKEYAVRWQDLPATKWHGQAVKSRRERRNLSLTDPVDTTEDVPRLPLDDY
jgi:hypothetical protein